MDHESDSNVGNNYGVGGSSSESSEQMGSLVHSQVKKIKQEFSEKIVDWFPGKPERRENININSNSRHRISRSPLGISGRPISVGD